MRIYLDSLDNEADSLTFSAKELSLAIIAKFIPQEIRLFETVWGILKDIPTPILPKGRNLAGAFGITGEPEHEIEAPKIIASITGVLNQEKGRQFTSTEILEKISSAAKRNGLNEELVQEIRHLEID